MLVVVHYGDRQLLLECLLNVEALGSFDVFQVYPPKGGRKGFDNFDELIGVFFVNLDVEYVNAGIDLEEKSLPLHHRFTGECPYITQSQYGSTIGNHGYEVAFGGKFIGLGGVLLYIETRDSYPGAIGKGKIVLCAIGLGRSHLYLTGLR